MARKGRRRNGDGFEVVPGGSIRRIEFEGDGRIEAFESVEPVEETKSPVEFQESAPVATPSEGRYVERTYRPRHKAPLDDIRFEVDHLHEIKAGHVPYGIPPGRTDLLPKEELTLYRTERGKVSGAESPSGRRVLYTEGSTPRTRRRFTSTLVDAIVKDVVLEETVLLEEEAPPAPKPRVPWKKTPKAAPTPAKKDTGPRPQCAAITNDGLQCRNSARHGSKYCSSHKGYRVKSMEEILEARDTKPAHKVAADTLPGKTKVSKEGDAQAQCAALTAAGMQCKNSSRKTSKYCSSHKGYRPQQALASLDTKPRAKNAKDTKPAVRKK